MRRLVVALFGLDFLRKASHYQAPCDKSPETVSRQSGKLINNIAVLLSMIATFDV